MSTTINNSVFEVFDLVSKIYHYNMSDSGKAITDAVQQDKENLEAVRKLASILNSINDKSLLDALQVGSNAISSANKYINIYNDVRTAVEQLSAYGINIDSFDKESGRFKYILNENQYTAPNVLIERLKQGDLEIPKNLKDGVRRIFQTLKKQNAIDYEDYEKDEAILIAGKLLASVGVISPDYYSGRKPCIFNLYRGPNITIFKDEKEHISFTKEIREFFGAE